MAIPRRFSLPMREIWMLQLRLELAGGRRSQRVLGHPRFRAAYDFLLLRGEAGEVSKETCQWWTGFHRITSYNVCYTKLLRKLGRPIPGDNQR